MKLRCTENSIRIRIRKSELDQLTKTNRIAEEVHFGNQTVFTFVLHITDTIKAVEASYQANQMVVNLPMEAAERWMTTSQVSIEAHNVLEDEKSLHILVEKDFPCTDRAEEDKSDTFWELAPDSPDAC